MQGAEVGTTTKVGGSMPAEVLDTLSNECPTLSTPTLYTYESGPPGRVDEAISWMNKMCIYTLSLHLHRPVAVARPLSTPTPLTGIEADGYAGMGLSL